MQLAVTYACGHTVSEVRYGGKYEEQLERAKKMLCPECYRAQKRAEALEAVSGLDMVALEGSPKQVAWAEEIRARRIAEVRSFFSEHQDNPEAVGLEERMIAKLAAEASAKWWIDRRDYTLRQLLLEVKQSL